MKNDMRGPLITARSFFRELRSYGYNSNQILHVITELIALLTRSVRDAKQLSPECLPRGLRPLTSGKALVSTKPRPSRAGLDCTTNSLVPSIS